MSSNEKNHSQQDYDPFHGFNRSTFPFFDDNNHVPVTAIYNQSAAPTPEANIQAFDPSYMSFTDCLNGGSVVNYNSFSRAFDMSCSSSNVVSPMDDSSTKTKKIGRYSVGDSHNTYEKTSTPDSSVSCSSNEDEDSSKAKKDKNPKGFEDQGNDKSKKANKATKKEKRPKEARFAFLTKSEIDNLEDGYRWRKYGQKAVKNSPYPRSYYRCTSPKCGVKKRVERSFQDPSVVITTYEGKHDHHIPTTLRGHGAGLFSPSFMASSASMAPSFPHEFLSHFLPSSSCDPEGNTNSLQYQQQQQQQQLQIPDYGLLQDLVSSFTRSQTP